ncbi:beta strand repeat-containing protein [Pseudovibrio sp. WM33]|uniref:beta strand repeat-containing protein n=1 Tax=Pseudovibrio sp. WM33 TaxID=1735585 RepID=UPI0007AECB36|nr:Ig-like domain-containing protein [Pseudovibrio sp. WM33]
MNLTSDACRVTRLPNNDEALITDFNAATGDVVIAVNTDVPSAGLGVNTLSIDGTPQTIVAGPNIFLNSLPDNTTITLTGTHNNNTENFSFSLIRSGGTVTLSGSSSGGIPTAISVTSGNNQNTEISTSFSNPLVVTVTDSGGDPVANETVTFTAPATGASLSSVTQTATTDASGVASLSATANATSGSYVVEASVGGVAATADFSLTNDTGAAASIVVTSGNNQNTAISSAFTNPLVVTVTDSGGNPVASETVTFTAPATGASLSSVTQTATTNASGVASLSVTANAASGAYVVEASVGGVAATADFSLINNTGAASAVSVTSGNNQSTAISSAFTNPLVVTVTDSGGNPVASETVTFTAPATGASLSSVTQTATTNASGVASLSVTANATSGAYVVEASVGGVVATADFSLTNNTGAASLVAVTSGNNQSTAISSAFTNPLVVTVTDSGGNPVASETVTFTAPATGASLSSVSQTATTNASGMASLGATANATNGSYVVEASVGGVVATADFSLSNTSGPSSIVVSSGNNQSTEISNSFSDPLVVAVTDAGGNPVANETITFTAPSSGASLTVVTQTATTNAAGIASLTVTANDTVGSYVVEASAVGVGSSADFSLTNARDSSADIARTKAVIGAFVGTRANQIVAEQPKLVQRLRTGKFGQQKGLNSFFYDVSSARQQASFQFSYASFMNKLTSLNTDRSSQATSRIASGFDQVEQPK